MRLKKTGIEYVILEGSFTFCMVEGEIPNFCRFRPVSLARMFVAFIYLFSLARAAPAATQYPVRHLPVLRLRRLGLGPTTVCPLFQIQIQIQIQLYKICFANFEASVWHAKCLHIAHRRSVLDGRHQLSLGHGHEVTSRR